MEIQNVKMFRYFLRRFERALFIQNDASCCNGITLAQCHVLMELSIHKNLTIKLLADLLELDKSTISRTVDNLHKMKLVDRQIPADDRRIANISLTEDGKATCDKINGINNDYYVDVLSAIPPDQLENFMSTFEKILDKMENLHETPKLDYEQYNKS